MFDREAWRRRTEWYRHDRFGMFIHWGLYSIPARGEWVRSEEQLSVADYEPFYEEFRAEDFDPVRWARLAKEAGMKYAVLTAKHHDGFCLFDTKLTDYKATCTPCGRDIVGEFVDAFRAEGLKVGLYYSLLDWHHPDYPHFGDAHHPMRNHPEESNERRDFSRYLDYLFGQVKELCTNYGKLDLMWFDFSYGEMMGEKWRATELVKLIRSLQPDILLDNRLEVSGEGFGSLVTSAPSDYCGDFVSPEQIIPPEGIRDVNGEPVPWEACFTLNNHWGYCQTDRNYKPAAMVVRKLVECVSKGGNCLVNVGPNARGQIPEASEQILREIGRWMHACGQSIYGCDASGLPKPDYGRITRRGSTYYYHILDNPLGHIPLFGLKREDIRRVRLLESGSELKVEDNWMVNNYPTLPFVTLGESPELPDPTDTVLMIETK